MGLIPKNLISVAIPGALHKAGKSSSEANQDLVRKSLSRDSDDWTHEYLNSIIESLGDRLSLAPVRPPQPKPPEPRIVLQDELTEMMTKILDANPWIDRNSYENGERIAKAFMEGPPTRSIYDMRDAVSRVSAYLKRTPKPLPPQFPDKDFGRPLINGMPRLPLNATEAEQRAAKLIQSVDLIERLRQKEKWDAAQNQ